MKKTWKKVLTCFMAVVLLVSFGACSTTTPTGAEKKETPKENKDIKVAAILISSASQVTTAQGNAMKAYAEKQGVQFTLQYYDKNIATEQTMIENAITSGVDVLILQPQSDEECTDVITKATKAGIVTILYGVDAKGADYTYFYAEDSKALGVQIGEMAADWANKNLVAKGEAVNVVVGNYSVSPIAVGRHDGVVEALQKNCPEANIVATYDMAYKEEGLKIGEAILQSYPKANLIVGINDQSACGVYESFMSAGLKGKNIAMFGIDGTPEAQYYISLGGFFKGTLTISPNKVGEEMVQAGIDKVKKDPKAPANKKIYWAAKAIDSSNINDFKEEWAGLAK